VQRFLSICAPLQQIVAAKTDSTTHAQWVGHVSSARDTIQKASMRHLLGGAVI
jgi:hypothetical protein